MSLALAQVLENCVPPRVSSMCAATEPEFLVCDEPTSVLDVSVQAQVPSIMKNLKPSGA